MNIFTYHVQYTSDIYGWSSRRAASKSWQPICADNLYWLVCDNYGPSLKVHEMVACHSERGCNRFRFHLLLSIKILIGEIRSVWMIVLIT